jgi:CubicO group peptidase (beta-lactamase class C family)
VLEELATAAEMPPPDHGLVDAPGSIDELRRRVAAVLERNAVPGVAIALVGRDGPIWVGGVGVADLESRAPVGADTVFRVASITKSLVGLGVMRLVERGRLDLDRPLRQLMPEVAIDNPWEAVAPVTLAHALEHTAGLDDMRFNETFTVDEAMTPSAALAINPRSRTIRWRPGSRMAYSNVGFTLAGRAIEVATGEPFDAWLRREVLRPLGMRDADFVRTPALRSRLATGYVGRERAADFAPIAHRPAGALLASANDLAKLVHFWLQRGQHGPQIVSPAGLDRIERSGTLPFVRTDVDYGLGNYGVVGHPVRARGHNGGLPGFASTMLYFPELGVGYVVISARAHLEIRGLVFATLVRGRRLPTPEIPAPPPRGPDGEFFAFASPRHELFGFLDRALLGWRAESTASGARLEPLVGAATELVPTVDGGYRRPGESGTSLRFAHDRDGTPVMISGSVYAESGSWWLARARVGVLGLAVLLLQLAPLWGAAVLGVAALRRRAPAASDLTVWPAVAGLALLAIPRLLAEAGVRQLLGIVHPLTIAICATTVLFALASGAGLVAALRWSVRADRPGLAQRLVPTLTAVTAFAMTVWLGAHGIIGLRTWAW